MEFKRLKLSNCKIDSKELDFFYVRRNRFQNLIDPYPIIVEKCKGVFNILYGFQKFLDYKEKSNNYIPAYILAQIDLLKKIKIIIRYQRAQRDLYLIEISKIISFLLHNGIEKETIATEIADILGINRGYKVLDKYKKLVNIPDYIIDFLLPRTDSLKIWSKFVNRNEKIFKTLLEKGKPSLSELLEIENNLYELSRREASGIDEISQSLQLFRLLDEDNSLKRLRSRLKAKRYPLLTKTKKKINTQINKLDKPGNIELIPDKNLETKSFKLVANIKNIKDIKQFRQWLNQADLDQINKILESL
ncbi:MAG: hypothetical protein K9M80_09395 [Candidatus Marinimicrobia bacterium]|nr:hypothetical protein [Candidatus Neomarinimicrobiota bacterium]